MKGRTAAGVPLWVFAVILAGRLNLCALMPSYAMFEDTGSYLDFQTSEWLRGGVSNGRAPLYGVVLDVLDPVGRLFGSDGLHAVVLVQLVCSFAALFLLADLLRGLGVGRAVAGAAVLCYGLHPAVTEWDISVMTESLSVSAAIAFFWCAVRLMTAPRRRYGALALLLCVFLALLRPQFLTYPVMLLVFFLLKVRWPGAAPRRLWWQLAAAAAAVLLLFAAYAANFRRQTGLFSLTDAAPRQNLVICIERGYYADSGDPEFVAAVEAARTQVREEGTTGSLNETWSVMWRVLNRYGCEKVDHWTRACLRKMGARYWRDTAALLVRYVGEDFTGYVYKQTVGLSLSVPGLAAAFQYALFQWLTLGHAMLLSLAEGFWMVWRWRRDRRPPWVHMALFSITATTVYLAFVITCGEYMRTMLSVLPYLFTVLALAAQKLVEHIQKGAAA